MSLVRPRPPHGTLADAVAATVLARKLPGAGNTVDGKTAGSESNVK